MTEPKQLTSTAEVTIGPEQRPLIVTLIAVISGLGELAAEYLVMAAMLAEIKSRMLLPRPVHDEADEEDPRAELVFGDGIEWVANSPERAFDIILVDSTDPVGPAEGLFTRAFYRDCHRALAPGGLLAINEFALSEDGVTPPQAAVFGVNMLVNTERGWTYTVAEMRDWLTAAGLQDAGAEDLLGRSTLVLARKSQ